MNNSTREIKFSGRRVDNGELVYGDLLQSNDGTYIVNGYEKTRPDFEGTNLYVLEWYEVNPKTIGQFTGLKDKNGVEIYTDCIVQFNSKNKCKTIVKQQKDGLFTVDFYREKLKLVDEHWRIEVIDNIYENPGIIND